MSITKTGISLNNFRAIGDAIAARLNYDLASVTHANVRKAFRTLQRSELFDELSIDKRLSEAEYLTIASATVTAVHASVKRHNRLQRLRERALSTNPAALSHGAMSKLVDRLAASRQHPQYGLLPTNLNM